LFRETATPACVLVSPVSTLQQLHALGVTTSDIKKKRGGKIAFFRDPDGNELRVWEYDPAEGPRAIVHSAELRM